MKLSVSQIKTFSASKAQWAGKYILGIKEEYSNDSLLLGQMFEHYLVSGEDNYEILKDKDVFDIEKLIESYDTLKHNALGLELPIGDTQVKVEGKINGVDFVGYLDNVFDGVAWDIKTSQYLSKEDNNTKNFWSGMSYYEEYELQLWIYMKLGGFKTGKIAEIAKFRYKDESRHDNQIITFEWSEKWDNKMCDKYFPIINEMQELYNKYTNNILS